MTLSIPLNGSAGTIRYTELLRLAWREARPIVQLIFMLRFLAGAALSGVSGVELGRPQVLVAAVGWLAATWAIYLLNGVADVVEDRENGSTRPIARGAIPEYSAIRLVWLLAVLALVCAAAVSMAMMVLVGLMLSVGWAYSTGPCPLKRSVPGFFVAVTMLGLLTYLAGWSASGGAGQPCGSVVAFGLMMSLWMGLAGSTKDLSDAKGDRLAGRRTLPVILGDRRARLVIAIAANLLSWTFVIIDANCFDRLLPAAVVVCAGSVALALVALGYSHGGHRYAKRRPYRAFMITQYLAHVTLFAGFGFAIGV
jgi:4-hydroxybenzoate polyprenyltransferase